MIRIKHIPVFLLAGTPTLVFAQASPFLTGVTSLQENILEWLTPIAIILVMVLGGMAMANRMSQPEGDQRLWFVVDELDALGQIDGLKDALARLRKFGGRSILGFQSIAQVSSTYGTGDAQTLVENCGNTLILRCSGSDHGGTANFASRLIGQREVLRTNRSRSRRPGDLLSSTTLSEHVGIEPAVMDSQIEQLPDLAGYLKFASTPNWQQVTLSSPDVPDSGQTRDEAKTLWHRWRADPAARATNAAGPTTAPKRTIAARTTIDHGPILPRDNAEYE